MMVQVHPKQRDYLFVAGQRRRTPIMETEAKVRTATGVGRNPETRNIAGIARETGMTSQSVSSCRTRKREKVTNKVKILLTLLVMLVPMMLLPLLLAETNDEWVLDTAYTFL